MAVTAYSPIAAAPPPTSRSRIGAGHGKTAVQVCLRFLVQQDIVVIAAPTKWSGCRRMRGFILSAEEMSEIAGLASGRDGRLIDWSYSGRTKWDRREHPLIQDATTGAAFAGGR